jgi:hypothetical protein
MMDFLYPLKEQRVGNSNDVPNVPINFFEIKPFVI